MHRHRHVFAHGPPQNGLQVLYDPADVHGAGPLVVPRGEGHHLADQRRPAAGGLLDDRQIVPGFLVRKLITQHLDRGQDRGQQIVEVVGHPPRHGSDGLQALGLPQALLEGFGLGPELAGIADVDDAANDLSAPLAPEADPERVPDPPLLPLCGTDPVFQGALSGGDGLEDRQHPRPVVGVDQGAPLAGVVAEDLDRIPRQRLHAGADEFPGQRLRDGRGVED
jgi:hypothetical protein